MMQGPINIRLRITIFTEGEYDLPNITMDFQEKPYIYLVCSQMDSNLSVMVIVIKTCDSRPPGPLVCSIIIV